MELENLISLKVWRPPKFVRTHTQGREGVSVKHSLPSFRGCVSARTRVAVKLEGNGVFKFQLLRPKEVNRAFSVTFWQILEKWSSLLEWKTKTESEREHVFVCVCEREWVCSFVCVWERERNASRLNVALRIKKIGSDTFFKYENNFLVEKQPSFLFWDVTDWCVYLIS